MDKKARRNNVTVCGLKPPKFGHLKPLSIYSRMTCNRRADLQQSRFSTFDHLKIEVRNNWGNKRKLHYSSPDEGHVNPLKKPFSPEAKWLTGNSNPRLRVVENGSHPRRSSKPRHNEQTVTSGHFTVAADDLSPAVSEPLTEPVTSAVERLEGETKGVWDISLPMLESSLYGTVRLNVAGDRSLASESSGDSTDDTNLEDAWENTLPLQVQVKSKVVVPCQHIAKPEEDSCARTAKCSGTQRHVIFGRRSDWEKKKRLYVSSVMRHMQEKRGTHNGVMSELLKVMNRVADERAGKDTKRWQHPSDLTCRNYQSRFGTKPETTLREWQRKNYGSHKRFSKVRTWFERCHCP